MGAQDTRGSLDLLMHHSYRTRRSLFDKKMVFCMRIEQEFVGLLAHIFGVNGSHELWHRASQKMLIVRVLRPYQPLARQLLRALEVLEI